MPEFKSPTVNFKGWQAIVVIIVLIVAFTIRLVTISDKTNDTSLMRALEVLLMCDYFPNEADRMRAGYETGDANTIAKVVKSVTSAKLNIESVKASYPLFDTSAHKEVVVKVTYSLVDDSGPRDRKTNYYLFNHGSLGNIWQYQYETTVVSYYLNFL